MTSVERGANETIETDRMGIRNELQKFEKSIRNLQSSVSELRNRILGISVAETDFESRIQTAINDGKRKVAKLNSDMASDVSRMRGEVNSVIDNGIGENAGLMKKIGSLINGFHEEMMSGGLYK